MVKKVVLLERLALGTKMKWHRQRETHSVNTLGRKDNEGQVKLIRVGQTITQAGNTQEQEVKYLKREER